MTRDPGAFYAPELDRLPRSRAPVAAGTCACCPPGYFGVLHHVSCSLLDVVEAKARMPLLVERGPFGAPRARWYAGLDKPRPWLASRWMIGVLAYHRPGELAWFGPRSAPAPIGGR